MSAERATNVRPAAVTPPVEAAPVSSLKDRPVLPLIPGETLVEYLNREYAALEAMLKDIPADKRPIMKRLVVPEIFPRKPLAVGDVTRMLSILSGVQWVTVVSIVVDEPHDGLQPLDVHVDFGLGAGTLDNVGYAFFVGEPRWFRFADGTEGLSVIGLPTR